MRASLFVGLIPIVGAVKYADEVGPLVSKGIKGLDEAAEAGTLVKQGTKGADEVAEAGTLMKQGTKGGTEADGATKTTVKSASDPDAESEAMAMAAGAENQVYEWPAGYKPSPLLTDEEVREFVARGWLPPSPKPSPIATDDELRRMLELEKQEGLAKPLSNGVEEMEDAGIAARNGKGYNGGEGLAEGAGDQSRYFKDEQLKTAPNTAYFWSGNSNGIGGKEFAMEHATKNGGITLEGLMKSQGITMPTWDIADQNSIKAWEYASGKYAEQVSGEVHALIGTAQRQNSVWRSIELRKLMENPYVSKIVIVAPETLIETIIFRR